MQDILEKEDHCFCSSSLINETRDYGKARTALLNCPVPETHLNNGASGKAIKSMK